MKEKKRVIIIGSGISGLTAGIYAAKAGFEAILYEQHHVVGGECTGWDRKGYHIDNCMHWLMGSTPGTELYKIWTTVGAIGEGIEMKRQEAMYVSKLNGQILTLWQDVERTKKEMIALSPEDQEAIEELLQDCKMAQKVQIPAEMPTELMGAAQSIKMLFSMGKTLKLLKKYEGMDTQDVMNRFKHPLIRCLISDFCPKESQGTSFVMAYGNFISGDGGIPEGGSRAMALRMKKRFESLGGKVFTGAGVQTIEVNEGKATGIILENGTRITGDYIIPACDLSVTFGKLLPIQYRSNLLEEMYENRKAYPVYNTFQAAFAVDLSEAILKEEVNIECPELILKEGMGDRLMIKMYGSEPGFAPEGKQILQTLQGGSEELYPFWQKLYENPKQYMAFKQEMAQAIIGVLEKHFPAFKGKLTLLDTWTPMTYQRYCSAYKGFYQAFQITKYSRKNPYPSAYIEGLENVILAGQWLSMPGGLPGAAINGKYAVQRILKKENRKYKL